MTSNQAHETFTTPLQRDSHQELQLIDYIIQRTHDSTFTLENATKGYNYMKIHELGAVDVTLCFAIASDPMTSPALREVLDGQKIMGAMKLGSNLGTLGLMRECLVVMVASKVLEGAKMGKG